MKTPVIIPRKRQRKIKSMRPLSLGPDGVEFVVEWDEMQPGMSLFVPCVDVQQAVNEVNYVCERLGWTFEYIVRIESSKMGVRFWRIT
jgi:hypothetical protein